MIRLSRDATDAFLASDSALLRTPGHKRNPALVGDDPFLLQDAPYGWGSTSLHRREPSRQAELAARAWGASSGSVLRLAARRIPNQAVATDAGARLASASSSRARRTSRLRRLVLSGLEPVWVLPDIDSTSGLALSIPVERIAEALARHARRTAVVLVEPSYLGLVSDIEAIARELTRGTFRSFVTRPGARTSVSIQSSRLARSLSGADVVVTSVHKTLTAFSQGALLLANDSGRIDLERLGAAFDALLTTSPSAAIYASLDRARALVERDGHRLLWRAWALAEWFRREIDGFAGARCFAPSRGLRRLAAIR